MRSKFCFVVRARRDERRAGCLTLHHPTEWAQIVFFDFLEIVPHVAGSRRAPVQIKDLEKSSLMGRGGHDERHGPHLDLP